MTIRRFAGVLSVALIFLHALTLGATTSELAAPGAPTIGIATAGNGQASVTFTAPENTGGAAITGYLITTTPIRGVGVATTISEKSVSSSPATVTGLVNGTVYRFTVRAANSPTMPFPSATVGPHSAMSNPVTPALVTVPALDPTITWVLPSGSLSGTGAATVAMAEKLRTEIGEGPKAKIGLSTFLRLDMTNWLVDTASPAAMSVALADTLAQLDIAIANAVHVKTITGTAMPLGISLVTAIRESTDVVETAAEAEDLRNVQWYHDWPAPARGNGFAHGWTTYSQYARKMRSIKEAYVRAFGRALAVRMAANPDILVAVTGDGEIEMTYERFRDITPPAGHGTAAQRSWADYSPFAVLEFRDWLRGKGMYAAGQPLEGRAYPEASRYSGDDTAALTLFNSEFGTAFLSWDLRYLNWSLSDGVTAGAVTSLSGVTENVGGFDAPRPEGLTIMDNTTKFWLAFRLFRNEMVQRYNQDFARWITEGTTQTDPTMGGVPFDRWYSAQVPTDVLFGEPAADRGVRLLTSGSPHWVADIAPYGGMGVTGYNVNGGGAGGNGHYSRTVGAVVPKVAARSSRWAIVEWNPADPYSTSMDSYRVDNEIVRRFRPALLMPFKINYTSTPEHQWAIFAPAKFVDGLKELMQGHNAIAATSIHPEIPARPGIAGNQSRGGWLSTITWPKPALISAGTALSGTQLSATANRPGTFVYSPASGATLSAGIQTLLVTFTPTDMDYAVVTSSVTIQVIPEGGRLSGTVTNSLSSAVISGATVKVFTSGGAAAATTTTNSSGVYTTGPLSAGSYYVLFSAPGHRPEVHNNVACNDCDPTTGTAVSVTAGAITTVSAALDPPGSVTGRVTNSLGAGIPGAVLYFFRLDAAGNTVGYALETNSLSDGTYTLANVTPGTYVAIVIPFEGYVREVFDNISCAVIMCSPTIGTRILVTSGAATPNISFSLAGAGGVTGIVRGPADEAVPGVVVGVFNAGDQLLAEGTTLANGTFSISGLPNGTYGARVKTNPAGYFGGGTKVPFNVTVGGTATGVVLRVLSATSISGLVTDASFTGLAGIPVLALHQDGTTAASATTDSTGAYSFANLSAGRYWVRTANASGLIDRIYSSTGGADCLACGTNAGTAVIVQSGIPATGISLALSPGGSISGTVTAGGVPLVGAAVGIYRDNNVLVQEVQTTGLGTYSTSVGLPAGNYYLKTRNGQGYNDEIYNDNGCQTCMPNEGVAVAVAAATPRTDIDFALSKGGWVTGTVTGGSAGNLEGVTVEIYLSGGATPVATGVTNSAGVYRSSLVPAGSYYALARSGLTYSNQVFKLPVKIDCVICNASLGTGFGVSADAGTTINFDMTPAATISGTVLDGSTAIPDVTVRIYNRDGTEVASGVTNGLGAYVTAPGLVPGDYFARTFNDAGFINEVWDNQVCLDCSVLRGKPITVSASANATNVNFGLVLGGRIGGTVTDASGPIPRAVVHIHAANGAEVATAESGDSGEFLTTTGLPTGSYYAWVSPRSNHVAEIYNDIACVTCNPLRGQAIPVTAGSQSAAVPFSLATGGSISGTVRASTGQLLTNVRVNITPAASGAPTTVTTDNEGRFLTTSGLAAGTYYLQTKNTQGYIDQAYGGTTCLNCAPTSGTAVIVGSGEAVTERDFTLVKGGQISGTITRTTGGTPIQGAGVLVFSSVRQLVASGTTNAAGVYVTETGLPAGSYYIGTRNTEGLVNELYDNVACAPCDPARGTAVSVGSTVLTGIDFALASTTTGTIAGRVIDTASTPVALSGVRMRLFTSMNAQVEQTVTTNGDGRYSFTVPEGRYYLRTDSTTHVNEAYNNLPFTSATVMTGTTPILVARGEATTLSDIALAPAATVNVVLSRQLSLLLTFQDLVSGQTFTLTFLNDLARSLGLPPGTFSIVGLTGADQGQAFALGTVTVVAGQELVLSLDPPACTPPTFSTTSLANAQAGTAYSRSVAATGGTGSLTYSVFDGSLAPGLSISSAGAITGTPSTAGTALFTLGATDGAGCIGTREFAITVAAAPPVTGTTTPTSLNFAALKAGSAGALTNTTAAQTVSVNFTGASPDWTVSSSQPWLSLSAAGGFGAGSFTASIVNPSNVIGASTSLTANITIEGSGISNAPLTIPVTLTIDQTNGITVTAPIGQVDTPTQNATGVQGAIGVTGWVLDNVGVTGVKIYRNCLSFDNPASCQIVLGNNVVEVGDAAFLAGARPDVEGAFSTFPQKNRAGWGYLMLTSMLPQVTTQQQYGGQGALILYAVATDVEGNKKLLGRSSDPASGDFAVPTNITMANATIAKPFGAIDTPSQGQTVSGLLNNFGWALTPDTNTTGGEGSDILIPTNGSTMTVFIDSLPVALVAYNQCRGSVGNPVPASTFCNDDVSNIFGNATPQAVLTNRTANATLFRNLDATRAPIGVYSFNTTSLSNGLHTIAWSVSDSAGRNEGIGSRFFNVLNSGADQSMQPAAVRGAVTALEAYTPGTDGVWGRTGFGDDTAWKAMHAGASGAYSVRLSELSRVELWLGAPVDAGYLVAPDGTLRDLPVGSSVKGALFAWAPPAGYVGPYALAFLRGDERVDVIVTVVAAPGAPDNDVAQVRMHLDAPVQSGQVRIEGWSFDPQAAIESGIGHVHVWARSLTQTAGAAENAAYFLGAADLNVLRPDVAKAIAGAPQAAGFQLNAQLAPGTYELTAYVWNERTARWEDARSRTIVVK